MTELLFLNFIEACDRLGIGRSTGYALLRRGEFPVKVRKIGGRYKVAKEALERYAAGEDAPVERAS